MKKINHWYALAGAGWAVVGLIAGYSTHDTIKKPGPAFQTTVVAAPPDKELPGVRINYVGSGIFDVPSQVAPGTYIVTATGNTFGCFWARLKKPNDQVSSVIEGNTVNRGGFAQFTIRSHDNSVKFVGDCTWARI